MAQRFAQESAADIIKLAMIRIDRELEKYQANMLLQVHDELVLEAPAEEAAEVEIPAALLFSALLF